MMKKIILRIRSEQAKQLARLAKQQNVSIAEISQRAIDQFIEMADVDDALTLLVEVLDKSNDRAIRALEETEAAINQIRQSSPKIF